MINVIVHNGPEKATFVAENASVNYGQGGVFIELTKEHPVDIHELERRGFKPNLRGKILNIEATSMFVF